MVAEVPAVIIYGGDTINWPIYTFKDNTKAARNLVAEGWGTWRAQWRAKPVSPDSIELIVDASEAVSGNVTLTATGAQTEAMKGPGFWDLQAERNGQVQTFLRGKTKWTQDITRG